MPESKLDEVIKKCGFKNTYASVVGIGSPFTLRDHTLAVLTLYRKYFESHHLPPQISQNFFEEMLILHDVGKPEAIQHGDKRLQHKFTIPLMNASAKLLNWSEPQLNIAIGLLNGDPIGSFLKQEIDISQAIRILNKMLKFSGLPKSSFLRAMTIYYQMDTASYSTIGGVISSLDFLYAWNEDHNAILWDAENKHLQFSDNVDREFNKLIKEFDAS